MFSIESVLKVHFKGYHVNQQSLTLRRSVHVGGLCTMGNPTVLSGHMSLESRLIDHLLSNYSSDGRPVSNASEAVSVSIGMYLSKLLDLVRCL